MSLPGFGGTHKVGVSIFSSKIPKITFGTAKTKTMNLPAFELEEVAFEVFYPCEEPPKAERSVLTWLKSPLAQWADGYGAFLGRSRWVLYPLVLLISFVKIPAFSEARLKPHAGQKRWPLVFFSHGLAGTSRTYSQLCGKLAAEGNIVVAMEHRDGTAPSVTYAQDGTTSSHYYTKVENLVWPDKLDDPTSPMPLRTQQLEIRQIEILQAFKAMKALSNGDPSLLEQNEKPSFWNDWYHQFDVEKVTFIGHSFGGCTGLYLLANPPPSTYEPFPFSKAILHDPWMEPFNEDFEETFIKNGHNLSVPVLVINSEEFTVWKQHMARQLKLMRHWAKQGAKEQAFFTIVRSRHMGFSDFVVIYPILRGTGMALHNEMHGLSSAFLNGNLKEYLASIQDKLVDEFIVDNPDDNKRKKIRAAPGIIVEHPLYTDD